MGQVATDIHIQTGRNSGEPYFNANLNVTKSCYWSNLGALLKSFSSKFWGDFLGESRL